jgi:hypothetical protein
MQRSLSKPLALLCMIGALAFQAPAAQASVVLFDNGSFSSAITQVQRNYASPFQVMWEDFILGADSKLQELQWGGGEYTNSGISTVSAVTLTIYNGLPGSGTLVQSITTNPARTLVGVFGNVSRFDYVISGLDIDLDAGDHYWLGLSVTSTAGANWSNTAGTSSTIQGLYQTTFDNLPGSFYGAENAAFRLLGTESVGELPAPGTLALAGLGLLVLRLNRRKP